MFWLLPIKALPVAVTITFVVPWPEFITQPGGTDHVYKVASVTGITEYDTLAGGQTAVGPEIWLLFKNGGVV
jgi:hypothetical protein